MTESLPRSLNGTTVLAENVAVPSSPSPSMAPSHRNTNTTEGASSLRQKVESLETEVAKLKALMTAMMEHITEDSEDSEDSPRSRYLDGSG
jgi:uncharacterized protein YceH (UPF0502 family)